jgi:hypothetical protein
MSIHETEEDYWKAKDQSEKIVDTIILVIISVVVFLWWWF